MLNEQDVRGLFALNWRDFWGHRFSLWISHCVDFSFLCFQSLIFMSRHYMCLSVFISRSLNILFLCISASASLSGIAQAKAIESGFVPRERELIASKFVEALIRVAAVRYEKQSAASASGEEPMSLPMKLAAFFEQHVLRNAFQTSNVAFRRDLLSPDVRKVRVHNRFGCGLPSQYSLLWDLPCPADLTGMSIFSLFLF